MKTNLSFFIFAIALFSSSLSSKPFFGGGVGSGMGIVVRGIVAIGFLCYWVSSGWVPEDDFVTPLAGTVSVEGSNPLYVIGWGLKMVTEMK